MSVHDQAGVQHRAHHPMSESLPGISGRNVGELGAGMAADKSGVVDRIEHLPRPAVGDSSQFWDERPDPLFETLEALFGIVGFAALVVLAAHEQKIALP